jgi:hypothetical protein
MKNLAKSYFPNAPIIPTFGNNDMIENYMLPGNGPRDNITAEEYFRELF